MPSLGFTTQLYVAIDVEAFFTDSGTWRPFAHRTLRLGRATHSTLQNGFTFTLDPTTTSFLLRGSVTFRWNFHSKVVGQVTRTTTAGHRRDLGMRGRATCTI